eukprot:TRINITY_DN16789_c0_g1_i7.p1 TRINITY_DN16789_c0_g1~~TRINITY_DN16789_c0_g1_i7.p1  ORF type:complete len:244 (-),score=25.17 TRINITY_DN16789_c0_g1_i7:206-937(-)
MGFILSKFRRKKSTQDVLEGLEKEIKRISNNKRQSLVSQSTVVKKLLFYGILFWVIAFGCVFYLYYSAQKTSDSLFLPILILMPFFFFSYRSVSGWWNHQKINKDFAKLTKLKMEKSKILDEVMETKTYKVATQIFEKYDPSRLPGNKTTGSNGQGQDANANQSQSGVERLLSQFSQIVECPVCFEIPRGLPVPCCINGHIICKRCKEQWRHSTCPKCRAPLSNCVSQVAADVIAKINENYRH